MAGRRANVRATTGPEATGRGAIARGVIGRTGSDRMVTVRVATARVATAHVKTAHVKTAHVETGRAITASALSAHAKNGRVTIVHGMTARLARGARNGRANRGPTGSARKAIALGHTAIDRVTIVPVAIAGSRIARVSSAPGRIGRARIARPAIARRAIDRETIGREAIVRSPAGPTAMTGQTRAVAGHATAAAHARNAGAINDRATAVTIAVRPVQGLTGARGTAVRGLTARVTTNNVMTTPGRSGRARIGGPAATGRPMRDVRRRVMRQEAMPGGLTIGARTTVHEATGGPRSAAGISAGLTTVAATTVVVTSARLSAVPSDRAVQRGPEDPAAQTAAALARSRRWAWRNWSGSSSRRAG